MEFILGSTGSDASHMRASGGDLTDGEVKGHQRSKSLGDKKHGNSSNTKHCKFTLVYLGYQSRCDQI